jgi:hypothetical protein
MKQGKPAWLAALCALAAFSVAAGSAFAQTSPGDNGASMVKPPETSGTTNPANPDHMPVKRPPQTTHDNMTHSPPASAAEAK